MLVSLSWKNIWRNPLRSSVIVASIAIGLFGGIFSAAFMEGMGRQTIDAAVSTELAHVQLHTPKYAEEPSVEDTIPNAGKVAADIAQQQNIVALVLRTELSGMASTAATGVGVTIKGVNPANEARISVMPDKLLRGEWFPQGKRNSIIIGKKLADKLKVDLKKRIVLTFQTKNGDLTGGAFKVRGIFRTFNSSFDEQNVFVNASDLTPLLGFRDQPIHEIAVLLDDYASSDSVASQIAATHPDLKVQTWAQLQPEVGMMESLMTQMMYIFVVVILIALTFGIVNTMLMVVMERTREFGMLMAIGMSRSKVFLMVLSETVMLALVGGLTGMTLGAAAVGITGKTGIDLSAVGEGLAAMGYNPQVYPAIDTSFFVVITIMVVLTGIAASFYPALKALSLDPSEAVRSDT